MRCFNKCSCAWGLHFDACFVFCKQKIKFLHHRRILHTSSSFRSCCAFNGLHLKMIFFIFSISPAFYMWYKTGNYFCVTMIHRQLWWKKYSFYTTELNRMSPDQSRRMRTEQIEGISATINSLFHHWNEAFGSSFHLSYSRY